MYSAALALIKWLAAIAIAPSLMITGALSDELACCAVPMAAKFAPWSSASMPIVMFDLLKGAVADARDIENSLRRTGVQDVTALIDAKADRSTILSSLNRLLERTSPRDIVILSLAGHGAQEPERIRGTQPDGVENVFLSPALRIYR